MKTRLTVFACTFALFLTLPAFGDAFVDALFDKSRLHDVRISMSEADWARLRATFQENTSYDATLTFDGETIGNCTIRSRGSGTRNGIKPGLRVDFNKKVKSQTFHGFKTLVLDNMYNDPSFLREQLAFSVFEEVGILVPRESFTTLAVNGHYWGLYAVVEPIDSVFVKTHVDAGGGNLFEYNAPVSPTGFLPAWDFTLSRGETIDGYVPDPFEPKTNEDDLDGTALLELIRTVSEAPRATFVDDVSAFVDPHVLLTYYAVEVATAEVDGLTSLFGINNFYLYQLQGTQRFLFIPWDHDFNFTRATHEIYFGRDRNRLIQRLLADPDLKAFYRDTLQSIVNQFVNPGWMTPRIDSMVALISNAVLQDTKRRGGADNPIATQTYEEAVEQIRTVVAGRGASVAEQLDPAHRRPVRH